MWYNFWVLLTSAIFHGKSANFVISRKTNIDCIFMHNSNSFDFFWVCKDCFNKHGYNFDDVSKTDTLGLLRIKVFWNKGYDIVTFFYDVTNKIYHVTQIIL